MNLQAFIKDKKRRGKPHTHIAYSANELMEGCPLIKFLLLNSHLRVHNSRTAERRLQASIVSNVFREHASLRMGAKR